MPHPLETRIAHVRRGARRLLLLHGVSWVLAATVGVATAVLLADYLAHFEDRGIRIICATVVAGVLAWTIWRRLLPVILARFSDVDIAMRIERRFPGLNDRLASTVQFLREDESAPEAGSAALRRAVITQTSGEVERLDLAKVMDPRPARRALAAALGVGLVAALLTAADPASARLALARLTNPWGNQAWPQRTHLAIRKPVERLALGEAFEIAVEDSGGVPLPDEVKLHIRYTSDDSGQAEEIVPMRFVDGAMVYRKEGVRRPFAYRAVGGDDNSMPPIQLIVVEPPAIETMSVALYYPEYTGWPAESAEKNIRALKGTRVEVTATVTKPLRSARLQVDGGPTIDAVLADDGYGFRVPVSGGPNDFVIADSGTYRLLLEDRDEGVIGGRDVGYDIRAVADLPPTISIDEPTGNIFVTADAEVPLRIAAKDDLALRSVGLSYLRSDQSDKGDVVVPLYTGPDRVPPRDNNAQLADAGENRTVEHRWLLAELALQPGTQITFHATAGDYLPQSGQSQPRRLTVIAREDLENRIAERQTFILGELTRVLKMQRDARSQVAGLEIQMRDVGRMNKGDLDQLQGAEMTQRQVDRGLTSPTEGVPSQIEDLLADLRNNKVDSPDIERRMQGLLTELKRLEQGDLPAIAQALTGAIKGTQDQLDASSEDQAGEDEPGAEEPGDKEPGGDEQGGDESGGMGKRSLPVDGAQDAAADQPGAEPSGDNPPTDKPSDNPPADDQPAQEPAGDKPAGEEPAGDQPADDQPASEPAAGDQPTDAPQPGDQPPANNVASALNDAGQHQDEVVGTLERMLGELSQGENFGRVFREIGQLRRDQDELAGATGEIGKDTLTKDVKDLTPQQLADLKKLAARQQDLARRFDKVQDRMEELGQNLAQDDPLAADALADALQQARGQAVAGQMREAGQKLEQNQIGQAGGQQTEIGEQLQEMLDTLSNRREQELSRLVKKLKEAEAELADLRRQQQGLRKRMEKAAQAPDEDERRRELERLTREQRKLEEEVKRFARKLERLQAQQAAQAAAQAGGKMSQAGEQGEQGDAEGAQENADAAQKDLDEAQQELAQARRQAELDLAMEQLAKIEDGLRSLHDRQSRALDDTRRLDQLQTEQGKLTRAQSISVQDVSRLEQSLSDEATGMAKKLSAAEVFSLALKGVARELTRAADLLGRRELGPPALAAEEAALRRLGQLLESLQPDQPPPGEQNQQNQGEGEGGEGNPQQPGDGIPNIAQLKLLKLLQTEINERTKALSESHGPQAPLNDDQMKEFSALSEEQGQLAEMIQNLSQPAEDDPEADLENLPDMDGDEDANQPDAPAREITAPLDELIPDDDAGEDRDVETPENEVLE